ncbi:MAG: hypothetical protein J5563_05080, partial [Clostridia bacterium]|nr:hypothetical protein [Clostridia bacterium]
MLTNSFITGEHMIMMSVIKRITATALTACIIVLLSSCSESELPEGAELLPDLNTEYFTDENGRVRWPEEILPKGFPVPEYEEIYSAERKENTVTVTVFSRFVLSPAEIVIPHVEFTEALQNCGYVHYYPPGGDGNAYWGRFFNKKARTRVTVYTSQIGQDYFSDHLNAVNAKSPTHFTMQIVVDEYDLKPESLTWEYPDRNTDLGLEIIKFDNWPSEYLPNDFVRPGEGIEIISMEQKSSGVFITLRGELGEMQQYGGTLGGSYGTLSILENRKS